MSQSNDLSGAPSLEPAGVIDRYRDHVIRFSTTNAQIEDVQKLSKTCQFGRCLLIFLPMCMVCTILFYFPFFS